MFAYAERTQFPILYHINDPVEFWYRDRLPAWAVEKDFYYGGGEYPHKFEIDQETFGILHKHPNLNLCIPHFFFISDQPGLCGELLDRYPNLYFDITPGWEMFENFAKDIEFWRAFFGKYSHKILFGTDTFSDHWRETVSCLRKAMETRERFTAFEENCLGMDLPEETLRDIYYNNYDKFVRRTDKQINVDMVLAYAETLYARLQKQFPGQVGRYHSEMDEGSRKNTLRQYQDSEIRILVSCRALDEGLNVPETDVGIIASSASSNRQRIQRLGRILRRSGTNHTACLYYLYIGSSNEERELLAEANQELAGVIPVLDLDYDQESQTFIHPARP